MRKQPVAAQGREPFERQRRDARRACSAPWRGFRRRSRSGRRQHLAPGLRAEQDIKRFRRRHEDVRRAAAHPLALGRGRVAGSDPGADFDVGKPAPPEFLPDAGERRLEVAMDVVRQRLERRDVDDVGFVGRAGPRGRCRISSSIAARKAASVLPEPVGAAIRVWRPALIAGQASACAGVGALKLPANHAATAGWNSDWKLAGAGDASEGATARIRAAEVAADPEFCSTL